MLSMICFKSYAASQDEVYYDKASQSYVIKEQAFREIIMAWQKAESAASIYEEALTKIKQEAILSEGSFAQELETLQNEMKKERELRNLELAKMTAKANRRWGIGVFVGPGIATGVTSPGMVFGVGVYYKIF